jgi:hypothetical protein
MPPSLTLTLYKTIDIHVKYKGEYTSLQGNVVIILVIRPPEFHGFLKEITSGIESIQTEANTYHTLGGNLPGNVAPGFYSSTLSSSTIGEDNEN